MASRLPRNDRTSSRPNVPPRWGVGMTELRVAGDGSGDWLHVESLLEDLSDCLHSVSLADGCSSLLPPAHLLSLSSAVHRHNLALASGAWGEHLLMSAVGTETRREEERESRQQQAIARMVDECRSVGIDILDLDLSFLPLDEVTLTSLVKATKAAGLRCRVIISFHCDQLPSGEPSDSSSLLAKLRRLLSSGLDMVVLAADSLAAEQADAVPVARRHWLPSARLAPATAAQRIMEKMVTSIGGERCMFESGGVESANWLLDTFGERVNLSVGVQHVVPVLLSRPQWGG